jgi:GDP-L-fucose synthase
MFMKTDWPEPKEFWSMRRVCVTGGAGFLGSYVVEKLRQRGVADIFVPTIEEYNLVESEDIGRMLEKTRPDVIIHLAAHMGGIGAHREHPAEFFYDNLMMGAQLMHAAWKMGVEKFVSIGSVCAYPKLSPIPFKEENLWDGYPEETTAPYGMAKKMSIVQADAYHQQYGFNAINLLMVNLYGPRDNFDAKTSHAIPGMIRRFLEAKAKGDKEVIVWGDGSPTREFLYVEDAAQGIVLAAERYNGAGPVNLGSGMEISIKELAGLIARLVGFDGTLIWDTSKPNGQPRRALDTSRAESGFGFRARMSFQEGLRRTIEWYTLRSKESSRI